MSLPMPILTERGNHVRSVRSRLKRELRAGPTAAISYERLAALLADPPPELRTMAIYDLLIQGHRVTRRYVLGVLRRQTLGERRQVGELTERQRRALVTELRGGLGVVA